MDDRAIVKVEPDMEAEDIPQPTPEVRTSARETLQMVREGNERREREAERQKSKQMMNAADARRLAKTSRESGRGMGMIEDSGDDMSGLSEDAEEYRLRE